MTLLSRHDARPRGGPPVAPPDVVRTPFAAGAGAALWSAALGLTALVVVVMVGWAFGSQDEGTPRTAVELAAQLWLLGHGADLSLGQGSLTMMPLGLTLLLAVGVMRSGMWAGAAAFVRTPREAVVTVATLVTTYTGLAVLVAVLAVTEAAQPVPGTALTGALVVSATAGTFGVLRGAGLLRPLWHRLDERVRAVIAAGLAAGLTLLAGGGVLVALSLVWHASDVAAVAAALDTDVWGTLAMLLLSLAYLPVAIVWAVSYSIGTGFAVGAGTVVAPSGTGLGDLPAFPLLGALPANGAPPDPVLTSLLLPLLAAVVLGICVSRRSRGRSPSEAALLALGAAATAGLGVALLVVLARGGLLDGRLATLGPDPLPTAAWVAAELGVIGAAVAWEHRRRSGDRR